MKNNPWIVAPLALLILAPPRVSAGAALTSQTVAESSAKAVDKTKDTVVEGGKTLHKYLKTIADREQPGKLLSLPTCP